MFPVAKKCMDKRGGVSRFSVVFFVSQLRKFVGEPFRVLLISVIEKIFASEGYVTIFVENSLSHSTETFRRGTLLCCVSDNYR